MSEEENLPPIVVLLVEDETSLLEITTLRLQDMNCEVIGASDPVTALEKFEAEKGRINFVFTDLRMKGMGGRGLIERLLERDPKVRIVATSALIEELDGVRNTWGDRVRLMLKPYNTEELRVLLQLERLS
jgi:CheY-like chemotaxis protein